MIYKVDVNGIEFSADGSSPFWFKRITGLDSAPYRNTIVTYSDKDGGSVPDQKRGLRIITLEGGVDEDSCVDHLLARQNLMSALGFNEWKPVKFYLENGLILQNYCKFDQPNLPIEDRTSTEFQLIMMCRYVDFYDVSGGDGTNSVEVHEAVAGGWVQDTTDGWVQYHTAGWVQIAGNGAINAVNQGESFAYPIITITGVVQNPVITNETTGELFKVNITTSSTDTIVIDMRMQSTTLNGGNINALVDVTSSYFTLKPGDNMLLFNTDAGDGFATVEWFATYGGA